MVASGWCPRKRPDPVPLLQRPQYTEPPTSTTRLDRTPDWSCSPMQVLLGVLWRDMHKALSRPTDTEEPRMTSIPPHPVSSLGSSFHRVPWGGLGIGIPLLTLPSPSDSLEFFRPRSLTSLNWVYKFQMHIQSQGNSSALFACICRDVLLCPFSVLHRFGFSLNFVCLVNCTI